MAASTSSTLMETWWTASGFTRASVALRDERRRQVGVSDQPAVDGRGGRAALGDGPHDEALTAAHVAGHEHARHVGGPLRIAGHVAASGEVDAEVLEQPVALRTDESHGQQHQLAGQLEVAAL